MKNETATKIEVTGEQENGGGKSAADNDKENMKMSKKKIDLEYWFCVKDGCVTYELYRKVLRKINGKTVTMLRDNMGQEMPIKYFKKSLTDREKKTMVLAPGEINHSESGRNSQLELTENNHS